MYISSVAQEGRIRSPIHRLIHELNANTIHIRKDDAKVLSLDVFYLWCNIMPNTFCNISYYLAKYLGECAVKDRKTLKICGGMFVTNFGRLFDILERRAGNALTMLPIPKFNPILYKRARMVEDYDGGNCLVPDDDEVVVPEQPGRRVR